MNTIKKKEVGPVEISYSKKTVVVRETCEQNSDFSLGSANLIGL